jgi:hypothetical protein
LPTIVVGGADCTLTDALVGLADGDEEGVGVGLIEELELLADPPPEGEGVCEIVNVPSSTVCRVVES